MDTPAKLPQWVVLATRIPTNYNSPTSYVVEAATDRDAREIVRHQLRDLADIPNYDYKTKTYTPPPRGKVLDILQES